MDEDDLRTRAMWLVHDIVAAKPDERRAISTAAIEGLTEGQKGYVIGNALSKMAGFFDDIRSVPAFDAEMDITLLGLALELGPRPYEHPGHAEASNV